MPTKNGSSLIRWGLKAGPNHFSTNGGDGRFSFGFGFSLSPRNPPTSPQDNPHVSQDKIPPTPPQKKRKKRHTHNIFANIYIYIYIHIYIYIYFSEEHKQKPPPKTESHPGLGPLPQLRAASPRSAALLGRGAGPALAADLQPRPAPGRNVQSFSGAKSCSPFFLGGCPTWKCVFIFPKKSCFSFVFQGSH